MKCPYCNEMNEPDANFCQTCGKPLLKLDIRVDNSICPRCHHTNIHQAKFCENCGYSFADNSEPSNIDYVNKEKNKIIKPITQLRRKQVSKVKIKPAKLTIQKVILVALLIIVVGSGAWLFYDQKINHKNSFQNERTSKLYHQIKTHKNKLVKSGKTKKKPKIDDSFPYDAVQTAVNQTLGNLSADNSVYVSKIGTKTHYVVNSHPQRAASIIKIFIMIAAYDQAVSNKINLTNMYTVRNADKVSGTGVMQNMADGTTLSYDEVLKYMMDDSDNMAANVMIDFLGGIGKINEEIQKIGVVDTHLGRKMMDTNATQDNMTSVSDLGLVLNKIYEHKLINSDVDDKMLDILNENKNHSKLPAKIEDAVIYNKTGEYIKYGVENDAAIISRGNAAFIAVVMSENGQSNQQIEAESNLGQQLDQLMFSK